MHWNFFSGRASSAKAVIFPFSSSDEFIYWTDWQKRSIERVNKWTGADRMLIIDEFSDLMGLKAIRTGRSKSQSAGTCSRFCVCVLVFFFFFFNYFLTSPSTARLYRILF